MKIERKYAKITVSDKGKNSLEAGHPWVYDNAIEKEEGNYENGELVDVISTKEKYLGTGFINRNSKIRVRIISNNTNDTFDEEFWKRRLKYAWEYRKSVMGNDIKCCRIIFGEADQFPGLTIDRFNDILVAEVLSLGMEKIKPMIFNLLYNILVEDGQKIKGIYERNDVPIRGLEGMEENKGFFELASIKTPKATKTKIVENGIKYIVDFENGQKTGYFLDQKYNRLAIAKIAKDKSVLDCFTHTGSFGLNAAVGGAKAVHSVDISETAINMAKENASLNGLTDKITYEVANVFDILQTIKQNAYDFIILDPPAFTKSRKTIDAAIRGYKEINYRAIKALPRGGYLATCSCSHFIDDGMFLKMLREAAEDANVSLKEVEARKQAPDHPILLNVPETAYLKFYIFQVV